MKRTAALYIVALLLTTTVAAQSLNVRLDGDQLRISAPRLRFLAGEALDRLRDGATVKYEFQLTAKTAKNGRLVAQALQEFAISYDLWEEKFSIKKLGPAPRSISHLSAAAAETWCLDNTSIPLAALGSNQVIWIRLDYQANTAAATAEPSDNNSGLTLTGLIDIFSRRTRPERVQGFAEAGPIRLGGLKRK